MNGTLEEKKETLLNEKIEREEWMDKELEDMTEEERIKLKEFEVREQRLQEERDKMRKNLENELKNLKSEINEICSKFDEKLLVLFRRKLEYDQRISEQQLYVVRLNLATLLEKEKKFQKMFSFLLYSVTTRRR